MPRNELDDAVNELRKWFRLFSLEEFVQGDLVRSSPAENPQGVNLAPNFNSSDSSLIKQLSSLIVETQRGCLASPALMREFVRISEEFERNNLLSGQIANKPSSFKVKNIITPFYETEILGDIGVPVSITEVLGPLADQGSAGINSNPSVSTKNAPTVSMIFNRSTRISLSNKNGNALSIFFNTIPTMEWSRAIPILDVKFQFNRPSTSWDKRATTPSTVKFLNGSSQLPSDSFSLILQTAVSRDKDFEFSVDRNPDGVGESGMELFTMPQTLVNGDEADNIANRATPIIDKFRPLASLRKFEVDVSQAAGVMSYRTAKLSFTLHDRSRLNEIADFIKAGLYNETEMLIEWGWEHPDKDSSNAFAKFINALKIKEKYKISNYDLQLKTNGEVDIDLSIYTKGGVDMFTSKVADLDDSIQPQEFIHKLQEKIATLRKRVYKQDSKYVEEIRGQQIINMAADNNSNLTLTPALRRELRKTLSALESNPSASAKELKEALENMYGTDGTDGAAKELKTTIASAVNAKMELIKGPNNEQSKRTPDPFLDPRTFTEQLKKGEKSEQFVSLAKLMLLFVVQPLARTKKFDDIQLIFYGLNEHAGFGARKNLGEFPIDISNFQKNFKKLAIQRRTANISVSEFIRFISNRYLEDISNPLYGLREFFRYEADKETGKRNIAKKPFKDPTVLNRAITERMNEAGIKDGNFKLPKVDFYVECIPASPDSEGQPSNIFDGLTVLRIHVFDGHSSSFESQQSFLESQRRDAIETLGNFPIDKAADDFESEEISQLNALISKATERGLIEIIDPRNATEGNVYKFKGTPQEIKEFIAETMPTIIYGSNNTSILDAGFRTMQDAKLTTINMINAGDKGDLTPNGGATNGLPIRLFPAQMNMRTIGCPLIEFTQSMFCDFGTGTSFDNVYAATKIQHSLEPGKFYSQITWTPLDAYGKYQNVVQKVNAAIQILSEYEEPTE